MSFEDLPKNFAELPITTPGLAPDLVDLFFRDADRAAESLLLIPAGEDGIVPREVGPIVIGGVDWRCPEPERERTLRHLAGLGIPKVIVAFGGERWIAPHVLRYWRDTAVTEFSAVSTEVVGVFVANMTDVVDISTGPIPVLWAA